MSIRLRVMLIALLLFCTIMLISQAKHKAVDIRYTLPWLLLIFVLAFLVFFPGVLSSISVAFGTELPINFLFLSSIVFLLGIIYSLTIAVSKLNAEVKDLTQKIALLEKKIRDEN